MANQLIAHYGVLIVVLIIFAGEIGLPTLIPGEIALLIAGVQIVLVFGEACQRGTYQAFTTHIFSGLKFR